MKNPNAKFHAPEHDHRHEAEAIKAERQDVVDNPTPPTTKTKQTAQWIGNKGKFAMRDGKPVLRIPGDQVRAHAQRLADRLKHVTERLEIATNWIREASAGREEPDEIADNHFDIQAAREALVDWSKQK